MSGLTKTEYPVKWIPVHSLSVLWTKTQRGLNDGKVKRIMDAFDPDALGSIIVTMPNGEGIHHVIDGQHRVEAVRRLWGSDQRVPCVVLEARTPSQAAEIWMKINTARSAPSAVEQFKIAVQAGRQPEVEVDGLIRGHGYTIDVAGGEGTIRAVRACMKIRRQHGIVALKETFEAIQACWGMDADSTHQGIVGGFGELFGIHKSGVDRGRLADKVTKKYTPARLIAAARGRRDYNRGSLSTNVAELLRVAYNSGLRSKTLEGPA